MTTTSIWLRRASGVRTTHRPSPQEPGRLVQTTSFPFMGFSRLQGFGPRCLPWHEYHCLPGFVPLQRHHRDHATAGIPAPVLPALRFSQPLSEPTSPQLADLFHPAGTPRVRPSKLDPRSIGARFPALAPSPLATSQGFHPTAHSALIHGSTPTPLRVPGSCAVVGSSPLAGPASLSGFARP
jgi:hypothetical protein